VTLFTEPAALVMELPIQWKTHGQAYQKASGVCRDFAHLLSLLADGMNISGALLPVLWVISHPAALMRP